MNRLLNLLIALCSLIPTQLWAHSNHNANPLCLAKACGGASLKCGLDGECRRWLQCVLECGDDQIKCPSRCGFFYQSQAINQTSSCIFASHCVDLGFSTLAPYEHAARPVERLEGIQGSYWFVASHGGSHIFDYDCQRFDFAPSDIEQGSLAVTYSVPLTLKGTQRITRAHGVFKQLESGAVEVIYDNFSGYHEKWYVLDKTEDTILAQVCIDAGKFCYDYGTVLLARDQLANLDPDVLSRINGITQAQFGFAVGDFHQSGKQGCAN